MCFVPKFIPGITYAPENLEFSVPEVSCLWTLQNPVKKIKENCDAFSVKNRQSLFCSITFPFWWVNSFFCKL